MGLGHGRKEHVLMLIASLPWRRGLTSGERVTHGGVSEAEGGAGAKVLREWICPSKSLGRNQRPHCLSKTPGSRESPGRGRGEEKMVGGRLLPYWPVLASE